MKEALLYEKLAQKNVRCQLCAHRCSIVPGKRGICSVRENQDGTLYSLVYRKLIAAHVDPIEKKPFFHFYPGSRAFSVATVGCNFRCLNCQNYDISQLPATGREILGQDLAPEEIVAQARQAGCLSISYTYTEPTIFFEYAYDTAKLAKQAGLKNNFVTNGYMTEEALNMISPYLDAANVDLKSFRDEFYKKVCSARLEPVLKSLRLMKKLGVWVEVTTLIIPTLNDSEEELRQIAGFIKNDLGSEVPWHISAFHPDYKLLDLAPTSAKSLERVRKIGLAEGLKFVYTGNIPGDEGENTFCYSCGKKLISRQGFIVQENKVKKSLCPFCGAEIDGVGL